MIANAIAHGNRDHCALSDCSVHLRRNGKDILYNLVGPPTRQQRRTVRVDQALSNSTFILFHKIDPRLRTLAISALRSMHVCPRIQIIHLIFTSNTSVPNSWLSFRRKPTRTLMANKKKTQPRLEILTSLPWLRPSFRLSHKARWSRCTGFVP